MSNKTLGIIIAILSSLGALSLFAQVLMGVDVESNVFALAYFGLILWGCARLMK